MNTGKEFGSELWGDYVAVKEFAAEMATIGFEKDQALPTAIAALHRLVKVCQAGTGQSYKVRALLYSLWNGRPRSLLELVSLDWKIRKDLLAVMLAFGHKDFFYDQIKSAFQSRGLMDWFIAEGDKDL